MEPYWRIVILLSPLLVALYVWPLRAQMGSRLLLARSSVAINSVRMYNRNP